MHYATLLLAASAALVSSQQSVPENYAWEVVDWTAGCASECSYSFSISGQAIESYPSFTATCSGYDTGAFVTCESASVTASDVTVLSLVAPSTGDGAHLQVSVFFDNADDGYVCQDLINDVTVNVDDLTVFLTTSLARLTLNSTSPVRRPPSSRLRTSLFLLYRRSKS